MFRKRKPEPQARQAAKAAVKLTAAEKREISRILETARGDGKVHSAQDTLPFRQMYPDGLCKLDDHTWSKCIEFEDVNYQLAKPDDQTAIFEALCDMYNAHDASIGMQLSLVSRRMNREDFVKRIEIAAQGDHFDHIRELYTQMLRKQLERGNNGLIKTKYLTLTIEARDSKTARARFSRIVMDALNHFKVMGALAKELGGKEWLEMLHGILHPDGERFAFEWSWLAPSGLSVQDFIAPSSFRFGEARKFTMADKFCAVSFLQISAPEMDDRMLTELLDTDNGLLVSLHIRSMDQNEAIKTVKRKITDIDSMKIDAQKKAVREGFDMDIIPTDLATYAGEAKNILRDLQSRNERMFLMTFLVVNFADSKQKLENDLLRAASVALFSGHASQGASTITQQLARNFFLSPERTLMRKIKEVFLAIRIEQLLTKDEILELYLNKIYLGYRAYGVGAAAQVYFGKTVDQLTLNEMAVMACRKRLPPSTRSTQWIVPSHGVTSCCRGCWMKGISPNNSSIRHALRRLTLTITRRRLLSLRHT